MAPRSLLWPDPRVKPPFGAAEIDWGHPLANGLATCLLFNEGGGNPINIGINGVSWARVGPPIWVAGQRGLALRGDNTAKYVVSGHALATHPVATWDMHVTSDLVDSQHHSLARNNGDGTFNQGVYQTTANVFAALSQGFTSGTTTVVAGQRYHVAGGWDFGGAYGSAIFVNGIREATGAGVEAVGSSTLRIGADEFDQDFSGDIEYFRSWTVALPTHYIAWLAAEPYAMLRPIVRRRYFVPAAAAAGIVPVLLRQYRARVQ